jgi:hypothetical protein
MRRTPIDSNNGEHRDPEGLASDAEGTDEATPLELHDVLVIGTGVDQRTEFEVVGLVEDEEGRSYAVCYSEAVDEFVVTDADGTLLADDELAQEILDDFFVLAEESSDEPSP